MIIDSNYAVPRMLVEELEEKRSAYCLCIPVINEGARILHELERAAAAGVYKVCDIVICDNNSTDGSMELEHLQELHVNTLLVLDEKGKQGSQLRMGFGWALARGYEGIITIDGNDKDSIEDVSKFIDKLNEGYDFVQGSRYVQGGKAINTPFYRHIAVTLIHAPIISLVARKRFTDTTNNFRAYSKRYLMSDKVQPFRDIFVGYELLAYLSVRASQLKMKTCEVGVTRAYPKGEMPSKISPIKGSILLLKILILNAFGYYNP